MVDVKKGTKIKNKFHDIALFWIVYFIGMAIVLFLLGVKFSDANVTVVTGYAVTVVDKDFKENHKKNIEKKEKEIREELNSYEGFVRRLKNE